MPLDKFPEAFRRFESTIETKNIQTFQQLLIIFKSWSGEKWKGTPRQIAALAIEARRLKIPIPKGLVPRRKPVWRQGMVPLVVPVGVKFQIINVRGKPQAVFRNVKGKFVAFGDVKWQVSQSQQT